VSFGVVGGLYVDEGVDSNSQSVVGTIVCIRLRMWYSGVQVLC
jgi:hypothetical protein